MSITKAIARRRWVNFWWPKDFDSLRPNGLKFDSKKDFHSSKNSFIQVSKHRRKKLAKKIEDRDGNPIWITSPNSSNYSIDLGLHIAPLFVIQRATEWPSRIVIDCSNPVKICCANPNLWNTWNDRETHLHYILDRWSQDVAQRQHCHQSVAGELCYFKGVIIVIVETKPKGRIHWRFGSGRAMVLRWLSKKFREVGKSTATNVRKWARTSLPTIHLRTQNGSDLRPNFTLSIHKGIGHKPIL